MVQKIDGKFNLTAISPVDGRYASLTQPLSLYFSEFALIKMRVEVELRYLLFLSERRLIRPISRSEKKLIEKITSAFSLDDAQEVKRIEKTTHHDVKAVEYFLRKKFQRTSLKNLIPFIHIGLTSEDINNICWRYLTRETLNGTLLPMLFSIEEDLRRFARLYKSLPMLGRTHGQPAVPTTLGKEIAVFAERLKGQTDTLKSVKFRTKFSGAVGNWNALGLAFPTIDLIAFSRRFLKSYGLETSLFSTQTPPYEDLIELLQILQRINLILINLAQDLWRYISDGWLILKVKPLRVGSSTMPQKVNPIEFENSEGNLFFANGILETIISKISVSRLQRDLSGSTVLRNLGVLFSHNLIGYSGISSGFKNISVDRERILSHLDSDWRVLSEAFQTLLRKDGNQNAFEEVAVLARKGIWTKDIWQEIVTASQLSKEAKRKLLKMTPGTYIGLSAKIIK